MSTRTADATHAKHRYCDRVDRIMAIDPSAPALEFDGTWHTWGELRAAAGTVAQAFRTLDLPPGAQAGVLLRNRPSSIGLLLGVLLAGGCVVALNPHVGARRLTDELDSLDLALLAGSPADVDALVSAPPAATTPRLTLDGLDDPGRLVPSAPATATAATRPGTAVRLLTSGTTGPPKRIELTYPMLLRVLQGAKHYERSTSDEPRLRDGIVIVNAPLVHLGGLFRVLQSVHDGRRMSLLERFTVEDWVDRVRRHRPKTASLVPAALRMVLDAGVDPDDLASLRSVVSGTAPLDPDLADAFHERYGVPVLTNYAATEFGGGVAGWNVADHERYWAIKRGSVGRAHPGCSLRVVDEQTGSPLPRNEMGLLEVRAAQLDEAGWVRTSDLARIDEDGFVWIVGRADQTILRGGLKVQPTTVVAALERHPAVRAAAVVGVADDRLGQVPVAVVERRDGASVDAAELLRHAGEHLARYELPVAVVFVASLPRTESAKVDLSAVRELANTAAGSPGSED